MSGKGWIIFVIIIALAIGGAVYVSRQGKVSLGANVDVTAIQPASAESGNIADHTFGTGKKITLIEYGDYQCPGCYSAYPVLKQLVAKYQDKLTFVFRNKLIPGHQNSRAAASFAEAAGEQGKFWEMHDKLYETQKTWETLSAGDERTNYFADLIQQIGGDPNTAKSVIESDNIAKKISFDDALATKQGVTGTPSLYLNGKDVASLYALNGKLVPAGTTDGAGNQAQVVWSNVNDFDTLVLQPAFKDAGVQ